MNVNRKDDSFADALQALLETQRSKIVVIVTIDGKQERGYGPVTIGRDYLQCRAGIETEAKERIYPLNSVVSVTPTG